MPTTANAFVRARVSEELRHDAEVVLADIGLTVSDLIRMTLTRVAKEKAVPFELFVPNDETRAAMEEARAISAARQHRYSSAESLLDGIEKEVGKG